MMNVERIIFWARFRRVIAALPSGESIAAASSVIAVLGIAATVFTKNEDKFLWLADISFFLAVCWAFSVMCLVVAKTTITYRKLKWDVGGAIKHLDETFESLMPLRGRAGELLFKKGRFHWVKLTGDGEHIRDLETIWDFFDDVAVALQQDNISDELAHHYFYYWLVGYYPFLQDYRANADHKNGELAWEHVEELFLRVVTIEKEKDPSSVAPYDNDAQIQFLKDESSLLRESNQESS